MPKTFLRMSRRAPSAVPPPASAAEANRSCYGDYYDKPSWWFLLRYDTQVKKKTCLHLVKQTRKRLRHPTVLEIGFGSGEFLFSFPPPSQIFGLELSPSAIRVAEQRAREAKYLHYGFMEVTDGPFPFRDCTFDLVNASHVIEHVSDDRSMLREIARVLKPDGIAVVVVPINERYDDPNHVRRYTTAGLLAAAADSGLAPLCVLENETLFHLVERFYYEHYNERWPCLGPFVAALFNVPTSRLPFWLIRSIDRVLIMAGMKPRQAGVVFSKDKRAP